MVMVKDISEEAFTTGKGRDGKTIRTGDLAWYESIRGARLYACVLTKPTFNPNGPYCFFSDSDGDEESWDRWIYLEQLGPNMGLWYE